MRVVVDGIGDGGLRVVAGLQDDWAFRAAGVALDSRPSSLAVELDLSRREQLVRVQGRVDVSARRVCDRCARPTRVDLGFNIDLLYLPEGTDHVSDEIELSSEDLDIGWYEADRIDLEAVLGEAIALELPVRTTCIEPGACDARTSALLDDASDGAGTGHPGFAVLEGLRNNDSLES